MSAHIKKNALYKGKAKTLYATSNPDLLIAEFRDDTTAFDGGKKEALKDKGQVNHQLSNYFMQVLEKAGVPTHFVEQINATESQVKRLDMLPIECVVRNIAAGSLCRRLGVTEKQALTPPLFELFYKDDELHDPMINDHHAISFGWATKEQLQVMHKLSLKINEVLQALLAEAGLTLVDAKYEFGLYRGEVVLGDEISPDSCRIWDAKTQKSLDKDRFRQDLGDVVSSYQEIANRLGITDLV